MSGYAVEPAELFSAEARVTEAAEDGRSALARLQAAGEDLFLAGWSGPAASAFQDGFDTWVGSAGRLLEALDQLGEALGLTARDYATTETTNSTGLQQLAS
jgi:WXG100 family type VII secretion target